MNNTCHRAVPHVPVLAGQLYSGSGGDEVLPDPEEVWLSRLQVASWHGAYLDDQQLRQAYTSRRSNIGCPISGSQPEGGCASQHRPPPHILAVGNDYSQVTARARSA